MPETTDVPIPLPDEGEGQMPEVPNGTDKYHALMEQNMGQLGQSGVVAQNNFITVSKAQDLDYLENKRHVSLVQALGAREVGSKSVPAGPTSSGT